MDRKSHCLTGWLWKSLIISFVFTSQSQYDFHLLAWKKMAQNLCYCRLSVDYQGILVMHSRTALGFYVKISRHNFSQRSREERFTALGASWLWTRWIMIGLQILVFIKVWLETERKNLAYQLQWKDKGSYDIGHLSEISVVVGGGAAVVENREGSHLFLALQKGGLWEKMTGKEGGSQEIKPT